MCNEDKLFCKLGQGKDCPMNWVRAVTTGLKKHIGHIHGFVKPQMLLLLFNCPRRTGSCTVGYFPSMDRLWLGFGLWLGLGLGAENSVISGTLFSVRVDENNADNFKC